MSKAKNSVLDCFVDEAARKRIVDRIGKYSRPDSSGCTLWVGGKHNDGYGLMYASKSSGGRVHLPAHRANYELHRGRIPAGLVLDHLCRTPSCINPDHLEPVTHRENVRRGRAGSLHPETTHCRQGHEYTPENSYAYTNPTSGGEFRMCKKCVLARSRARYSARKQAAA